MKRTFLKREREKDMKRERERERKIGMAGPPKNFSPLISVKTLAEKTIFVDLRTSYYYTQRISKGPVFAGL